MRNRYIILLLSLMWAVSACKPVVPVDEDEVSFDLSEVSISADAGKATARLTASGPWKVTQSPEWLGYVKPESGAAGVHELTFGGRFYDGSTARNGEVKVVCGVEEAVIAVKQNPHMAFSVSPEKIEDFPAEGGVAKLSVSSSFKPHCDCPDWITAKVGTPVGGTYEISLTIAANSGEERTATFRIHDGDSFESFVTISQQVNGFVGEKRALTDLYRNTAGASWTKSDNWCSDKPVSSWHGVSVDAQGHVTGLDLSGNNLKGSLPASMPDLKYLKELYLYGNCLSGSLPAGMRLMPGWAGFAPAKHIYPQQNGYALSSSDSEVVQYKRATQGPGIDIVILGDAFDKNGLELGKGFDALVEKAIAAIFAVEPMKSCGDYFNVYAISAESVASEISTKAENTAFGTYFTSSDFTVVTMNTNWEKVFQWVGKAPVKDIRNSMVVLLANTQRFGGTTLSWDDGRRLSIVPDFQGAASSTEAQYGFAGLVQHEAVGHAFGLFDEEYHTNGLTAPTSFAADLAVKQSKGFSLNISASPDLSKAPWSALAASGAYPSVGVFEGAGNYSYGAYRSEKDCCMVDNRPYFSAWCRYLLWKRIRTLASEDSSIEAFVRFENK